MFHTKCPVIGDIVCILILRKIVNSNSLITHCMSIFLYPSSILCFIFTYAFGGTTFFTDGFSVKIHR